MEISEHIQFLVQGSSAEPYQVTFVKKGQDVFVVGYVEGKKEQITLFNCLIARVPKISKIKGVNIMHKYHLCYSSFENAYWILTNKDSKESIEYNYSEMSKAVKEVYISYHNCHYADNPSQKEIDANNVIVRCLHRVGAMISQKQGWVANIGYGQILPEYTIDCYDYRYQCPKCEWVFDEIMRQGQERENELYCRHCREIV